MEVNNMVIAVFAIFLSILFTVNLINNYEQAAARIDAKKSYLELDNKLTNMKTDSDIFDVMFKNVTLNSTQFWVDTNESLWNRTTFGKYGWTVLHVFSANYPVEPTEEDIEKIRIFLYLYAYFFPCKMCGHHFVDMLNKNPINATSRSDLMFYLCNLHNKVNIRLSKPEFNCTRDLYTTYGGDCGCGNDDNSEENTEKLKNPT